MAANAGTTSRAFNELCNVCKEIMHAIRVEGQHGNLIHQHSLLSLSQSVDLACGICTVLLEHVKWEYLQGYALERETELLEEFFPILCSSDTSCVAWQSSFELTLTSEAVEDLNLTFTLDAVQDSSGPASPFLYRLHSS